MVPHSYSMSGQLECLAPETFQMIRTTPCIEHGRPSDVSVDCWRRTRDELLAEGRLVAGVQHVRRGLQKEGVIHFEGV